MEVYERSNCSGNMAKKVLFSSFQHIFMEKLEQSLKIKRHHRVQHTIRVQDSLTIRLSIEKSAFCWPV